MPQIIIVGLLYLWWKDLFNCSLAQLLGTYVVMSVSLPGRRVWQRKVRLLKHSSILNCIRVFIYQDSK